MSMAQPSPRLTSTLAPAGLACFQSAATPMRHGRYGIISLILAERSFFPCTQLFFWFFPPGPQGSLDDLIFWYGKGFISPTGDILMLYSQRTNGGPGCSSLEGLLQENGVSVFRHRDLSFSLTFMQPMSWSWGQAKPTQNQFSWTNLSSVLFVEQPVGTGFSQGTPNIRVGVRHFASYIRSDTQPARMKMILRHNLSDSCNSSWRCSRN